MIISHSSVGDDNQLMDTGATHHLTSLFFSGSDKVTGGNGTGLAISHVSSSSLLSGSQPLILKNVLHVPHIATNLLSVHQLGTDNNVIVEFYAMVFLVKYQTTKKALVQDKIDSDLYRLCAIKSVGQNAGANCANIDAGLVDATSIS